MLDSTADDTDRLRARAFRLVRQCIAAAPAIVLLLAGCETLPADTASANEPKTICREETTGSNLPRCKRGDNAVTTSREDMERSGQSMGGGAPPASSATGKRGPGT